MPLSLQPLFPSDSLSWIRIRALAYHNPTHDLVHGNQPISDSSIRGVANDRKREIGKPNTWHWKIVDTDLAPSKDDPIDNPGRTIAIAIWGAHNLEEKKEGSSEPTANPAEIDEGAPFIPPELRLDALSALLTPMREAQKEVMGSKPYLMLNTLTTHPEHQRRGAGKLLLDWGLAKADEEGLDVYLDSSSLARRIYEQRGFVVIKAVEFDREKWGGEGKDWHGCMVRKPQKTKN